MNSWRTQVYSGKRVTQEPRTNFSHINRTNQVYIDLSQEFPATLHHRPDVPFLGIISNKLQGVFEDPILLFSCPVCLITVILHQMQNKHNSKQCPVRHGKHVHWCANTLIYLYFLDSYLQTWCTTVQQSSTVPMTVHKCQAQLDTYKLYTSLHSHCHPLSCFWTLQQIYFSAQHSHMQLNLAMEDKIQSALVVIIYIATPISFFLKPNHILFPV